MIDVAYESPLLQKCINLDWLSVYCIEPKGCIMDANYYEKLGWTVERQPYGTTIYAEKFKLMNDKHVFLEIERNPYSLKKNGGIFEDGACHIRLSNRTCYQYNAIHQLQDFIYKYRYEYKGISRIDICCDFVTFDNGMKPQKFANEYMADKFWKVHQSALFAHTYDGDDSHRLTELGAFGKETKKGRMWNSLKWGSPKSPISTKLYNKTLELNKNSGKFYIKDAWVQSGLVELQKVTYQYHYDKTGVDEVRSKYVCVVPGTAVKEEIPIEDAQQVEVWRVEFSMLAEGRHWIDLERGKRIDLDLCAFDNIQNRAYTFYTCAEWLFCFVRAKWLENKSGQIVKERSNRCKKLQLFNTKWLHHSYKPQRQVETTDATRTERLIMNRLLKRAQDENLSDEMRKAALMVANDINHEHSDWYIPDSDNPFIRTSLDEIRKRREAEERAVMPDSAKPEDWMLTQDDSDSLATLNKNANRWKAHQQKKIQTEKQKILMCYEILKKQVDAYKRLLDRDSDLPNYIENILETPF